MVQPTVELAAVDLDDKYTRERGRVFLTGIQALVRLVLTQRRRDAAAGHDTAGYVTGYRGSPLGGLDLQLERAKSHLAMVAGVSVRSLSGSKSVRELTNRGRDGAISRRQTGRHVGKALESEGHGRRGATEL